MHQTVLGAFKSMHLWSLCLVVLFQIAVSDATSLPVCIVGAGPSGITAANELEALGRSAVIFEKENDIGGKAQNYYQDGFFYPLGPVIMHNTSYTEVAKLLKEFKVNTTEISLEPEWRYDWRTGATVKEPSLSLPAGEIQRYSAQWEKEYAPYANNSYEDLPDSLTVSTTEWMSKIHCPVIQAYITQFMAIYGYGNVDETPAIYTLQAFDPIGFGGGTFLVNYHELFKRYSQNLTRSQIILGSRIKKIDRSGDNVTIHYSTASQSDPTTQQCSDIIMAFSPITSALEDAGLELTQDESEIFAAIETTNYFGGVFTMNLPRASAMEAGSPSPLTAPAQAGEPIYTYGLYEDTDLFLAYSWATAGQSADEVTDITLESLSKINKDPGNITAKATPLTAADVNVFNHFPEYFAHFNTTALRHGWYDKLNGIQGDNRTYYTSSLSRFEIIESVVRAAKDLVQTYFTD